MLKIERFARIEEELKKKGSLEIPSLSQMLGCSEETVRRDLRELESVGKLNRIRGGAFSLWTIPNSMKAPISASMAWSWWTRSSPTRPSPQNGPPFVKPRTST